MPLGCGFSNDRWTLKLSHRIRPSPTTYRESNVSNTILCWHVFDSLLVSVWSLGFMLGRCPIHAQRESQFLDTCPPKLGYICQFEFVAWVLWEWPAKEIGIFWMRVILLRSHPPCQQMHRLHWTQKRAAYEILPSYSTILGSSVYLVLYLLFTIGIPSQDSSRRNTYALHFDFDDIMRKLQFIVNFLCLSNVNLSYSSLLNHECTHNVTMYRYDRVCIIIRMCVLSINSFNIYIYIYITCPTCHLPGGLCVPCQTLVFECPMFPCHVT